MNESERLDSMVESHVCVSHAYGHLKGVLYKKDEMYYTSPAYGFISFTADDVKYTMGTSIYLK